MWLNPTSGPADSFFLLISNTFLWLFECMSTEKVGLQAGLYSGKSRPDLYRTPHALQRVFGPSGPVLHCGVFWVWQWLHLLWNKPPPLWTAGFFFGFFTTGSSKPLNHSIFWTESVKIRQEVEDEEDIVDSVDNGDPDDQAQPLRLVRLVLAFEGTRKGKHGLVVVVVVVGLVEVLFETGFPSGSDRVRST